MINTNGRMSASGVEQRASMSMFYLPDSVLDHPWRCFFPGVKVGERRICLQVCFCRLARLLLSAALLSKSSVTKNEGAGIFACSSSQSQQLLQRRTRHNHLLEHPTPKWRVTSSDLQSQRDHLGLKKKRRNASNMHGHAMQTKHFATKNITRRIPLTTKRLQTNFVPTTTFPFPLCVSAQHCCSGRLEQALPPYTTMGICSCCG
jgi:hypothetical protein